MLRFNKISPLKTCVLALTLLLWACAPTSGPGSATSPANEQVAAAPSPPPGPGLRAVAGHFELVQPLGSNQRGSALVGTEFTMGGAKFGIDGVERDPEDPEGEIELYKISRLDTSGKPTPFCPSASGEVLVFPISGSWSAAGRHLHDENFSLICAGTVEAKCVRIGYRPWRKTADGKELWDYHEACVRALKADYCGTGGSHSADRAAFTLYDTIGIRKLNAPAGQAFEAAWGPRGAMCVRHVRGPTRLTLKDLRTECPNLPKNKLADSCDEREPAQIFSKSRDETPPPEN